MDIIGNGFIARHLRPLRDAHPGVTVLAAGVPRQLLPESEHVRETLLVRETICRCLADGHRMVFFSTASMYGGPGCRGLEDDPVVASTRYGRHKRDLERIVQDSGVDHLILRLGYVLGPHSPEFRLVPALIRQITAGRVRVHPGARRDVLYVSDFVRIIDVLLGARVGNEIVNVASGDCVDVLRMIEHIEARLRLSAVRETLGESVSHCPSVRKLRAYLPSSAALTFAPGYHRIAIDHYLQATGLCRTAHGAGQADPVASTQSTGRDGE
ncbi:NAD-dependent epimerase/dehydratase family protein [Streptomyces sp. NPDC020801]|uniref:NAD-dependent epimerase/dehydratase family protein n=1 Tax=unclassified Streptomyces TaxID=2593676 RepID=UPI003795E73E